MKIKLFYILSFQTCISILLVKSKYIETQKVEKLSLDLIFIDIFLKKYQMFYQTKLHVKNLLITRQKLTRTNNVHWSYWRTSSGTLFCILKSKTTNICCSAFSISFIFELRQFHFYIVVQVIEFSREGSKLYIPSTLNIALLQWHTHLNVCSKINHGLNHGLFISLLKLINCPIHWIVYE